MAYFSNGTEGEVFDEECCRCRFGAEPCPIALVQGEHNYSACNNPEARKILDTLVRQNGNCAMFCTFPKELGAETFNANWRDISFVEASYKCRVCGHDEFELKAQP